MSFPAQYNDLHVGIIGTGQVGTSLAYSLLESYPRTRITATDINPDSRTGFLEQLKKMGIQDLQRVQHRGTNIGKPRHTTDCFDLVFLAVPGSQLPNAVQTAAPFFHRSKKRTILADMCSNKSGAVRKITQELAQRGLTHLVDFVPFHILNGFAGDGPLSAKPDLLKAAGIIGVPPGTETEAQRYLTSYLQSMACNVRTMPPRVHDKVLSTTSVHEYVAMFSLASCSFIKEMPFNTVDPGKWLRAQLRIIDASPEMWASNFLDSQKYTLAAARRFQPLFLSAADDVCNLDHRIDRAATFAKQMPSKNIEPFGDPCLDKQDLSRSAFAALLSLALTENIKQVGEITECNIADICNPSAKDGMAPMQDPETAKKLIKAYAKTQLPHMAKEFMSRYYHLTDMIADLKADPKRHKGVVIEPAYAKVRNYVRDMKPIHRHVFTDVLNYRGPGR